MASKAPESCIRRDEIISGGVDAVQGPTAAPRGREELSHHAIARAAYKSRNGRSIVCDSSEMQSGARAPENETIPLGKSSGQVVEEGRSGLELASDLHRFTAPSDLDDGQEVLSANLSLSTRESSGDQAAIHIGSPGNVSTSTHCFRGSATSRPVLRRQKKGAAAIGRDASTGDDVPKNSICFPTGGSGRAEESRIRSREPSEDEIVSTVQCSGVEEMTPLHGRGATGELAPISDISDAAVDSAMAGLGEPGRGWFWGAARDC